MQIQNRYDAAPATEETAATKNSQAARQARRSVLRKAGYALAAALALGAPWAASHAQGQGQNAAAGYPNRPIKFIVPYLPGGLGDSFARAIGQGLSERLGQPVVIENMPGGSQAIGAAAAAKSAPDGYTWFMGTQSGLVFNTIARKSLPYDPVKDFAPVSLIFTSPLYLVVHPSVEAKSVSELVALAKSKPGSLSFASIGEGTSTHLAAEMFQTRTAVKLLHVPYKGSAAAMGDVLGGRVQIMFEGGASTLPHVQQGKLRVLASTAKKPTEKAAPGLPTLNEIYPGLTMENWFGMVVPAGVPRPIIDRLNAEIRRVQETPKLKELAASFGADIAPSTPEELGTLIRTDLREFLPVMRNAGIQPQ